MRLPLLLVLSLLLLVACQNETPKPSSNTSVNEFKYLALGDSYTIGESVPLADRWGEQLAELLRKDGIDVGDPVTIARTGWTTSELAAAIKDANLKPEYDLVSLLIGVNNQFRGQSQQAYRTEFVDLLQTSIRLAKGEPSNVIVLSIPDWGQTPFGQRYDSTKITAEIAAFNAIAKEESEKRGIPFINITPLTTKAANDPTLVANDGLHYSGKMHLEWAKLALPFAKTAIK